MKILIINSQGHWLNGWMTFPESLEAVVNTLQKVGCQVETVEVKSLNELTQILEETSSDTLVWTNAYWVNGEHGEQHVLHEEVQKYDLPILGSDLNTLLRLLDKGTCQEMLREADIPIPYFLIIEPQDSAKAPTLLDHEMLTFPLVIKPTKESRSQGVIKVDNKQEAITAIHTISKKFPHSNIIVENFLSSNDITCGFLKLGDELMLLPSYNVVKGMDAATEVFNETHYKLPPSYEKQVIIDDTNILDQLQKHVPHIVDLLDIHGVTRVDARLDKNGILKFFDINGMPGLNYPVSALIKQTFVHFPTYDEDYLFECLISTIVSENFRRYHMPVPTLMQEKHLFKLTSETILKIRNSQTVSV